MLEYELERKVEFPEDDELEHEGLPIHRSYSAQPSFDSSKLVLADVVASGVEFGRLNAAVGVLLAKGKYALEDLLGD